MDSSHGVKVKHQKPTTMKQSTSDIAGVHPKSHEYMYK
jgi:hypothetical protein